MFWVNSKFILHNSKFILHVKISFQRGIAIMFSGNSEKMVRFFAVSGIFEEKVNVFLKNSGNSDSGFGYFGKIRYRFFRGFG